MGPQQAIAVCLRKYATFSGRASRPEFWWFMGALWLGSAVMAVLDATLFGADPDAGGPLSLIFGLATFLPGLAAGWRRMQDTGRMGLYLLYPVTIMIGLGFAASVLEGTGLADMPVLEGPGLFALLAVMILFLLSPFIVLYWLLRPSQPGPNAYGPNPNEVMP
ncbi:DUF805 domain-containing protein [Meridianimarinicoccus sp. RP-17]|uniref:DUF805 domain-containing protein n=1 Tax=Meridianimarinicoccus zhengii TaxID=2056810 RepID=UPI000DAC07F7|nr:DUF805 domain-containing protein [Phycocomes zhengii]